jgi:hypothetical protein
MVCKKCEYFQGRTKKGKVYCLVLGEVVEKMGCGIIKWKGEA